MRKETLIALAIVSAAAVIGAGNLQAGDVPSECKVGFVNLATVLEQSREGKRLKQQLDAKLKEIMAPADAKIKQLDELGNKIKGLNEELVKLQTGPDQKEFLAKKNELENAQLQFNQLRNEIKLEQDAAQKKFQAEQSRGLEPFTAKLNKTVYDMGQAGGYCMILDTSPRAAGLPTFNPVLYLDPARDITDKVIKAVDGG